MPRHTRPKSRRTATQPRDLYDVDADLTYEDLAQRLVADGLASSSILTKPPRGSRQRSADDNA